ncbi:hypothetical protein QP572_03200 [Brevibacterium sp. UMB10442]|nr:hypothetical protein [Brevibacterium sp. UMB10442]
MQAESVHKLANGAKAFISALAAMSVAVIITCVAFGIAGLSVPKLLTWMALIGLLAFSCTFIAALITFALSKPKA